MDTPRPERRAAADPAARSHHIDAIAHLFLTGDEHVEPTARSRVRDVAVVVDAGSGGPDPTAELGRVQAALAPTGTGVCLAVGHGPDEGAVDAPDGAVPCGEPAAGTADWIRWRSCGLVGRETLDAWERASEAPVLALDRPAWHGLVWCADPVVAASLAGAQRLARLAGLLVPGRLEALVLAADGELTAAVSARGRLTERLRALDIAATWDVTVVPVGSRAARDANLRAPADRLLRP